MSPRYAPDTPLPPYAYIPGHGLPHPVNDPRGHLHAAAEPHAASISPGTLAGLPPDEPSRCRALAAALAALPQWRYAIDLFNQGFPWEAHEAWEGFWHALGRTTPEARFVQGLIHLAAACVKVREGRPAGVRTHSRRARELLGDFEAADGGSAGTRAPGTLGLAPESIAAVIAELERYRSECWHTSRFPVVKVLEAELRLPV